jgi:hypothetical protein
MAINTFDNLPKRDTFNQSCSESISRAYSFHGHFEWECTVELQTTVRRLELPVTCQQFFQKRGLPNDADNPPAHPAANFKFSMADWSHLEGGFSIYDTVLAVA